MSTLDLVSRICLPTSFPVFFPPKLEAYRRSCSAASDTPDEFAVGYMLAAGATATGGNVTGYASRSWPVRTNVFVAVVDYKGRGKSILADKIFGPLVDHEEALKALAAAAADEHEEDDDEDGGGSGRRSRAEPPAPCVIVNDVTGPAVLELLETSERQLLVNPDELAALFLRGASGANRQTFCELADGRRRRKYRVGDGGRRKALAAPFVSLLGTIQPDLLSCAYNDRGDDGLIDRILLVGLPGARMPKWPDDADDPTLNREWATAIERLFQIETLAADAVNGCVDVSFSAESIAVFKRFEDELKEVVVSLGIPHEQYGVINKIRGHVVRLALLHRCFRWAAGEFGAEGPLGNVDEADALAARDAAAFFLGRWLIWRPELTPAGTTTRPTSIGLLQDPGDDPVLRSLATQASDLQDGLRLVERVVRHLRRQEPAAVTWESLVTKGPLAIVPMDDLKAALNWLRDEGLVDLDSRTEAFRLVPLPSRASSRRDAARKRGARV